VSGSYPHTALFNLAVEPTNREDECIPDDTA